MIVKQRKGLRNLLIPAVLLGSLGLGSCGVQNPKAELKDHAQTGPERAKIVKVVRNVLTGGNEMETVFGLVSGQGSAARIYYFDCQAVDGTYDIAAVQRFAQAIGYAGDIKDLTAIDPEDGTPTGDQVATWHGLGAGEQPALKCQYPSNEASLRKVTYPTAGDKYFLTLSNRTSSTGKRILYHLGCDHLARSMGLDPASAFTVPYSLMTQDYDYSDEYDINCLSGVPVGQGVAWEQGSEAVIDVNPGDSLSALTFTAKNPDGNYAPLTYVYEPTPVDAACSWITPIHAGPSYTFFGTVPATFANRSCKITVTAAAGQVQQDKKVVVVRNRLKPVLQSDCPAQVTVKTVADYPSCTVTADIGSVQIASQTCPNSFLYDINTHRLILTIPPLVDGSCDVSLVSKNDDLVSDALSFSARRICDTGYTNVGGVCKKVACDSTHVYGDRWQVPIEGGQASYSCNARGQTIPEGVSCTSVGYENTNTSCQKVKCDALHSYGAYWNVNINFGVQTLFCEADRSTSIKNVSCNTGYTQAANFQCTRVYCGGGHYYGDSWSDSIPNGLQAKSCAADKSIVNGAITCNSGYEKSGNSCVPASCGGHPSGTSWNASIPHGSRTYSCSYGQTTAGAISCADGYYNKNGVCTEEVETDPPVCKKKPYLPQCSQP